MSRKANADNKEVKTKLQQAEDANPFVKLTDADTITLLKHVHNGDKLLQISNFEPNFNKYNKGFTLTTYRNYVSS